MITLQTHVSHPILVSVAAFVLVYALSYARWRARTRGRPLPPGPKSLPFIGNARHMSRPKLWEANRDLCQKYGDVVHVPVMGQRIILLGSFEATHELLEKRSTVTSGRAHPIIADLSGHSFSFGFMGYTPQWRVRRKAFTKHFNAVVDPYHLQVQRETSLIFLHKLLAEPDRLLEHIRYTNTAAIIKVAYGIDIAADKDRNIALMHMIADGIQVQFRENYAILQIIQLVPALVHLPWWTPIIGPVLQLSAAVNESVTDAQETLRVQTRALMEQGDSRSVLGKLLEEVDAEEEEGRSEAQKVADDVALVAFEGAFETTSSMMQFFFAAMALFPDTQRKAQAELDEKVGHYRLPYHSDRMALPYINALLKELKRWSSVTALTLPHHTSEDMEYKGYFIPKGSALFAQSWSCFHDPELYPEPERFMPERFLQDDEHISPAIRDPDEILFGYGRRVCPGRDFADASVFINIAMVLHVLNIRMPHDAYGKPLYTEMKPQGSFAIHPQDCRCVIEARSAQMLDLLTSAMQK